MRTLRKALLAGAAAIALGCPGAALAQTPQMHVMTVALPGGGVAQIRYSGNVAPRVSFGTAPAPADGFAPMRALFGPASPFATLDRISAAMDRQAAAMFREAEALTNEVQSGRLTPAALAGLPPGTAGYSFVSTISGNGICSQSIEITRQGNGPPRVVRRSSGNCSALPGGAGALPTASPPMRRPGPVWTGAPAPTARPDAVWASAPGATPYAGLVQPIPITAAQR